MKKYLVIPLLAMYVASFAQNKTYNLNFEETDNNLPVSWDIFGDGKAKVFADTAEKQEGKFAAAIESDESKGFKALGFILPENYTGKKITLSGYIKIENVTDGFAGLWMRIDPQIAFDNMQNRGIKGTTPWTKYEITLTMSPENSKNFFLGALLSGKGKMWVDNLKVSIDEKDIKNSKVFGSITAGADGNVSDIVLPGNISTMISGIGVYYPDGTETQRIGIVPDVEVKPTVEGIKNNKDEVLDKAVDWIRN